MILFLSSAFLRRIRIQWKPGLKGFLIGERNMFFLYPDFLVESNDFSAATIDSFLLAHGNESSHLLGFLSPHPIEFVPGYAELVTADSVDPSQWQARIHLLDEQGPEYRKLDLKLGDGNNATTDEHR